MRCHRSLAPSRSENEQLSKYGDTKTARNIMLVELKKLIEANPLFRDKLQFPALKNSRLRTLINQRYGGIARGWWEAAMASLGGKWLDKI